MEALQPEGHLPVHLEAVAIHRDPQAPVGVAIAQVLQGGIPQQPVDQHRFTASQRRRAHRQQLGLARLRLGEGGGRDTMHGDLGTGARILHGFSPGAGGIGGDPMAAGAEGIERQAHAPGLVALRGWGFRRGDPDRFAIIDLNHQMGAQAQGSGIHQGPVPQAEIQGPGTRRQESAVGWGLDRQLRLMAVEGALELLNRPGGRHLLQAAATSPWGRQAARRRGARLAAGHQAKGQRQGQDQGQEAPLQRARHGPSPGCGLPILEGEAAEGSVVILPVKSLI